MVTLTKQHYQAFHDLCRDAFFCNGDEARMLNGRDVLNRVSEDEIEIDCGPIIAYAKFDGKHWNIDSTVRAFDEDGNETNYELPVEYKQFSL